MGVSLLKYFGILFVFLCHFACFSEEASPHHIIYTAQQGNVKAAFGLYQRYCEEIGHQDFEVLQKVALAAITKGMLSHDPEEQLLSIFGAGVSLHEQCFGILKRALASSNPQLQVTALHFLAQQQDDRADMALAEAMSSNFFLIRLEAAYFLAAKRHAQAVGQIESLMCKVDESLHPLFPQLYAIHGSADALALLRRQLNAPQSAVRLEAILSVAAHGHDVLLPYIRTLADQLLPQQQEACATTLGILSDSDSIPRLLRLADSPTLIVKLAALQGLYRLGLEQKRIDIEDIAKEGHPFAISMLGEMPGSEETLITLLEDDNYQVKINAGIALLDRQNEHCLPTMMDILIRDSRDLALALTASHGGSLSAWKTIPSAQQNFKDNPAMYELSIRAKEQLLMKAARLPEKSFLKLACHLFDSHQNDLIPTLVRLLEDLNTPDAIDILKKYQQQLGSPFIRNYCNLALYRLKEAGPYADILKTWIAQQQDVELIRFRPLLPWKQQKDSSIYHLTPQETSRLLVESFESLAQARDQDSLHVLVDAIQYGNEKNSFALSGLLLRAMQ